MNPMKLLDALRNNKHLTQQNNQLKADLDLALTDIEWLGQELRKAQRSAASYKGKYESIKKHPSNKNRRQA